MAETDTPVTAINAGTAPAVVSAPVPAAPNAFVDMKKQNFHFKKEKDTLATDANGNPTLGADGKQVVLKAGEKHPTVEAYLPVPKISRLVEFLSDPTTYAKEVELLQSAVYEVIYGVARGQVNEFRDNPANAGKQVTPAVLNYDKLDFTAIALTPKSERGAYAPSDEELKAFLSSYQEVMPAAANRKPEQIAAHVGLFQGGFKKQKSQKDILELMAGMLRIYLGKATDDAVEEHAEVVEYFINKLARWIKAEEQVTMDML